MSYNRWKDKIKRFETMDVRGLKLDFLPELRKKALGTAEGEGLHIIQNFRPYPLYPVMKAMGYESYTEQTDRDEYHMYFYKKRKGE